MAHLQIVIESHESISPLIKEFRTLKPAFSFETFLLEKSWFKCASKSKLIKYLQTSKFFDVYKLEKSISNFSDDSEWTLELCAIDSAVNFIFIIQELQSF